MLPHQCSLIEWYNKYKATAYFLAVNTICVSYKIELELDILSCKSFIAQIMIIPQIDIASVLIFGFYYHAKFRLMLLNNKL